MKIGKTDCLLALALVALVGWGLWSMLSEDAADGPAKAPSVTVAKEGSDKPDAKKRVAEHRRRARASRRGMQVDEGEKIRERPSLVDDGDVELTELQKSVLDELRIALDEDDVVKLRSVIRKFNEPESKGGLAGDVPKVLRSHAITALGWFGSVAALDLIEFMADADPEIEDEAFAQFEMALDDWDVSDYERASILKTVMQALHDTDRIDMMLMTLSNMRNSVKGQAVIDILGSGTPEAKEVMQEQIEFYTDFDVKDANAVAEWIKNNPDDEWDDEFYGGASKSEDD